ncbi:MAG: tetratricopeptide repeat protein [Deltaproteobacteria bacterium]|nr:tetratricopeptide repeat protein [Deltaproteobacteria bacterium]
MDRTLSSEPPADPLELSAEDDFLYYLRRGADLLQQGRIPDARAALERSLELRPDSTKAQNLLGLAYFKLGLLEPARAIYERLVTTHPHEPSLHVNLGLVLLRQGRLDEAEGALRTSLMLAPDHQRAHSYLAFTLYRKGDLAGAREHFLKGGAPELAEKLAARLSAARGGATSSQALRDVADAGLDGLDKSANPFHAAESDERYVHDEHAWQTQVGHQRTEVDDLALELEAGSLPPKQARVSVPSPNRISNTPTAPRLAPGGRRESLPPAVSARRESLPPAVSARRESLPPAVSARRESLPPAVIARRESLTPRRSMDALVDLPFASAPISADPLPAIRSSRLSDEPTGRIENLPPIPFVEPSLRLFGDLSWAPGFSTGREMGPQARLVMNGLAYVRRSAIVAAVGEIASERVLRTDGGPGAFGGASDPILRLRGIAKLLLKVWNFAAALRDARSMIAVESALVGFEGEFTFESRRYAEIDLVRLEGRGSLLLDCPGAPVVATLHGDEAMVVSPDAVLAWSDGVIPQPAADLVPPELLTLRGHGLVIVAAPERDLTASGLASRL